MVKKFREIYLSKSFSYLGIPFSKISVFKKLKDAYQEFSKIRIVDSSWVKKLKKYRETHILNLFLSHKSDLAWIFLASSVANLLMLTPMLYMLQIFDRI